MEIDNRDCYWASFAANMSHDPNLTNDYHPPMKDSNCLPLVLLPLSGILCVLLDYMDKGNFWNVLKQSGRNKKKKGKPVSVVSAWGGKQSILVQLNKPKRIHVL